MSESGGDVLVNDVGVVGVSRLFDRTFDGVCEPAVQVLADHELPGVVEDTDVSVCHSFSELTRDLRSGLTQRRSPLTAGCIDADLHPQVEVTLASQANLSSRSHTCIMQCGSCSLKPAVSVLCSCRSPKTRLALRAHATVKGGEVGLPAAEAAPCPTGLTETVWLLQRVRECLLSSVETRRRAHIEWPSCAQFTTCARVSADQRLPPPEGRARVRPGPWSCPGAAP